MDLGLSGKVAVVSGASRGIGRSIALALAAEGAHLCICARNAEGLEKAAADMREKGAEVEAVALDVTETEGAEQLIGAAVSRFGGVDILVNNVGGSLGSSSLLDNDIETYMNVFNINFWASVKLMKIYSEKMVTNGWGRIINIASIFGREYGGKSSSYMSSKASLIAATKHLSIELADKGVTVNSIAPGSIKHKGGSWEKFVNNSSSQEVSDFINQNLPMKDFGSPEPVGDMVSFLSSPRSFTITGACINIDGGQSSNLF